MKQQSATNILKFALPILLIAADNSQSKESSRSSCSNYRTNSKAIGISCRLVNNENYPFYTVIAGTDSKDSMGYFHGIKPSKISQPKNWKSNFYWEEESDSYGIRWEPNSTAFELQPNDSVCCFKVEIPPSDSIQYKHFPVQIVKPDATFLNIYSNFNTNNQQ